MSMLDTYSAILWISSALVSASFFFASLEIFLISSTLDCATCRLVFVAVHACSAPVKISGLNQFTAWINLIQEVFFNGL